MNPSGGPCRQEWSCGQQAAMNRVDDQFPDLDRDRRDLIWNRWARLRGRLTADGTWKASEGYGPCSLLAALLDWEHAGRPEPRAWSPSPPDEDDGVWTSEELDAQYEPGEL